MWMKKSKEKRERKMKKQTKKKTVTTDNQRLIYLIEVKKKRNIFPILSLLIWTSPRTKTSERTANTTKRGQIWVKKRYRIRRSTKFLYLEENLWFKPMNFSLFRGPLAPSFLLVSRTILLIPTEHWISDFTTLKISAVYVFRFQFEGGFHDFISSMWYFHHVFLRVTNCSNQNFQEDDEK